MLASKGPLLSALARALPDLRASADVADRVAYARDLWPRHHLDVRAGRVAEHKPGAIVWPTSTADVQKLVTWAAEARVPLVPFGAGSGVCAGVLPTEDAVVVDLKRMAAVRAFDPAAPTITVEAGTMGLPFEDDLQRRGFTLGHFPSSIVCSTVGGWIAARSAGQCSGRYGKIEDMVVDLEVVTGRGEVVRLPMRGRGPSLVPLVVGSEGTMGLVTAATLRLHRAPSARIFASYTFPTTEAGMEALRVLFQAGLRPAVARLYDPFDAMLARRGAVKRADHEGKRPAKGSPTPGLGATMLRHVLRHPGALEELLEAPATAKLMGGALLVLIFEGEGAAPGREAEHGRALLEAVGGRYEGEGHARRWLLHRYAVSYRQAPILAAGVFVDTMEVAAPWSRLGALYDGVRRALAEHAFVMAHFSHAYPDGCCIYFSFAGSAAKDVPEAEWDEACARTYDRAWRSALAAAVEAGGTLAHHHGVGRSKAPRLGAELGTGIDAVEALKAAFDPRGIMNPGNLSPSSPAPSSPPSRVGPSSVREPRSVTDTVLALWGDAASLVVDRESLLAAVPAAMTLGAVEERLTAQGLTLGLAPDAPSDLASTAAGAWIEAGAPYARSRWLDPADQLAAGFEARWPDGRPLVLRPAPRRSVGPDLFALIFGQRGRFFRLERVFLRIHRRDVPRPTADAFRAPSDTPLSPGEEGLLEVLSQTLASR